MRDKMSENIVIPKRELKIAVLIIGVLIIGFIIGNFFPLIQTNNESKTEVTECDFSDFEFSDSDKNFLVNLANNQILLSEMRNDWCISQGGTWNEVTNAGELEINASEVANLEAQGIQINERDGKFYAQVILVDRAGCILPK